jgi:hypothetical protein
MSQIIKLDSKEYDTKDFSDRAKATLLLLDFATKRMQELANMQALLQRAKNSYVDNLKMEMLSDKAGFLLEEE